MNCPKGILQAALLSFESMAGSEAAATIMLGASLA